MSLHQVDLARQFADQIIGISAGSIVFEGTPDKLDTSDLQKIYEPQHLKLAQAAE